MPWSFIIIPGSLITWRATAAGNTTSATFCATPKYASIICWSTISCATPSFDLSGAGNGTIGDATTRLLSSVTSSASFLRSSSTPSILDAT
ncbi:MAG: hypothetical protein [Circular genetic element sp.]|nr:MAG: hypothetical protein [Circular genetic element sp.]